MVPSLLPDDEQSLCTDKRLLPSWLAGRRACLFCALACFTACVIALRKALFIPTARIVFENHSVDEKHSFAQQCGNWGLVYTEKHRRILQGEDEAKYLVVQSESGLSDTLVFITGMLYVAVLTGRALQISEEFLPYASVYDHPNIDWRETAKNASLTISEYTLQTHGAVPLHEQAFHLMYNGSLSDLSPEADILQMKGNTGMSAVLFDNPHYRQQLQEMGLRPETAFHCAMNFLFQPTMAVQMHFQREFEVMSSNIFKVAIQLRLGDHFTAGNSSLHARFAGEKHAEPQLKSIQHFFNCAEELEQTFNIRGEKVAWLVVSDSLDIRRLASEAYPERVLTQAVQPGHVAATEGQAQQVAMIQAAGEHWLVGMTDYQVISATGGFGKTGALRKQSWHTMYRLPVNHVPLPGEVVCNGLDTHALDYGDVAQWAPFV